MEECVLKDVFRRGLIANVSNEVSIQLALVAVDELVEQDRTPVLAVLVHQLLVRELTDVVRAIGAYGLNHLTFRCGRKFKPEDTAGAICHQLRESRNVRKA